MKSLTSQVLLLECSEIKTDSTMFNKIQQVSQIKLIFAKIPVCDQK